MHIHVVWNAAQPTMSFSVICRAATPPPYESSGGKSILERLQPPFKKFDPPISPKFNIYIANLIQLWAQSLTRICSCIVIRGILCLMYTNLNV